MTLNPIIVFCSFVCAFVIAFVSVVPKVYLDNKAKSTIKVLTDDDIILKIGQNNKTSFYNYLLELDKNGIYTPSVRQIEFWVRFSVK